MTVCRLSKRELFSLTAGTCAYWQAWVYLAVLYIPMVFVLAYLLKNNPALLERRMRMREKEPRQKCIMKLAYIPFLLAFALPGFDKRFGWSDVSTEVVFISDVLALLGYGIVFLTFRENSHASRIIEVESEQKVITTGPYAVVRHPMYFGNVIMYVFSPLALGSAWAMIPALFIIPVIVMRIMNEESLLLQKLEGYSEYIQKTRYRLIPWIW